jgi:hypothetical protein
MDPQVNIQEEENKLKESLWMVLAVVGGTLVYHAMQIEA